MKLMQTEFAAKVVLEAYKKNKLDEKTLNNFITVFTREFCDKDPSYEKSYDILKQIFMRSFDKRRNTGKPIDLYPDNRDRIKLLEQNLGVLFDEVKREEESTKRRMAILCLMHIIRKEVWYDYFDSWFKKIGNIGAYKKDEREKLLKEYFTIRADDDTIHLRNSIAHGDFKFINDHTMEFWAYDSDRKNEIFRKTLTDGDLMQINNIFEKKVRFLDMFIAFHIIMKSLSDYLKKRK